MRNIMLAAVLMGYSGAAMAAPRTRPAPSPTIFAMFLDTAAPRHLAVRGATVLRPTLYRARLYRG